MAALLDMNQPLDSTGCADAKWIRSLLSKCRLVPGMQYAAVELFDAFAKRTDPDEGHYHMLIRILAENRRTVPQAEQVCKCFCDVFLNCS